MPDQRNSLTGKIFIGGVILLISTIAYSSQLFIFLPSMGWTYEAFKTLFPFNILVGLVFYNYYLSVTVDPGRVPSGWKPPLLSLQGTEVSAGQSAPRFCKTCHVYKPPRAHHCSECGQCVLKMDHHCPWINNCVGQRNYGHFMRFVIYVCLACTYVIVLLFLHIRRVMNDIRQFKFESEPTMSGLISIIINLVLAFVVLFAVGMLCVYHLYCMAMNQSTIESWERGQVRRLIKRRKIQPVEYPFDVGLYRNYCAVLGPYPLIWLWPQPAPGDGLSFPVRPGTDPRMPYLWPPRDPDELRPNMATKFQRRRIAEDSMSSSSSDEYYDSGSDENNDDPEKGQYYVAPSPLPPPNSLLGRAAAYPTSRRDAHHANESDSDDQTPLSHLLSISHLQKTVRPSSTKVD